MNIRHSFFLAAWTLWASLLAAQEAVSEPRELAPGVWNMSVRVGAGPPRNVSWVEFEEGVLLFDTAFPVGWQACRAAIVQTTSDKPLLYWVVPHQPIVPKAAQQWPEEGVVVLAQENFVWPSDAGVRVPPAQWRFADRLSLELGARRIELSHFGSARTEADVILHLPQDELILTGLLCSGAARRNPNAVDRQNWIDSLSRVASLGAKRLLAGQGELADATVLTEQQRRLSEARALEPRETEGLGSTRGSRVAIEFAADQSAPRLVFLTGPLGEDEQQELRSVAPNVELRMARSRTEAMQHAPEVHGIDGRFSSDEFIRAAPNLRWVQAFSAGVDRYLGVEELMTRDEVVLTNMKGVHGPSIADHAFAMLLTLTRELRFYEESLSLERWDRGRQLQPESLHGRTMLVVGLGGIGSEIAKRAHGFGMRVLATSRSAKARPYYVERLELSDQLMNLLPLSDVVAVCVPLTPETEKMFGAAQFEAMKAGSYLINIARGRVCDTEALIEALESGQLGGACLDVTDPEPLPPDHALWKAPNLVLTPHVSGRSRVTEARRQRLFLENMRRFARGEPLLNVVDKQAGY